MFRMSLILLMLLLAGCSSAGVKAPRTPVAPTSPDASPTPASPAEAPHEKATPVVSSAPAGKTTLQPASPPPVAQIREYGPLQQAIFSFEDHNRIAKAVAGVTYARFPAPLLLAMPDDASYTGHVAEGTADQMVLKAREQPFTVTYQLQGKFDPSRFENELFRIIGSGKVTVLPNGDYHIATDSMQMVKQGDRFWYMDGVGAWNGPYVADNINNDLKLMAIAQLTPDQLGLLDVAFWGQRGGRIAKPDGTEEWYAGGIKLTTISILGSSDYSCYFYKLTVKKREDGYRPAAVDIRFWDAANLGLHAEWNFESPAAFPAVKR